MINEVTVRAKNKVRERPIHDIYRVVRDSYIHHLEDSSVSNPVLASNIKQSTTIANTLTRVWISILLPKEHIIANLLPKKLDFLLFNERKHKITKIVLVLLTASENTIEAHKSSRQYN